MFAVFTYLLLHFSSVPFSSIPQMANFPTVECVYNLSKFVSFYYISLLSLSLSFTSQDGSVSVSFLSLSISHLRTVISLLLSIFYNYFLFSFFPYFLEFVMSFLCIPPLLSPSLPSPPSHSHKHTLSPPISLSECHEKRQRKRGGI